MIKLKKNTLLLSVSLLLAAIITISSKSAFTDTYLSIKSGGNHGEKDNTRTGEKKAEALFSEVSMDTYRHSQLLEAGLDSSVFKKAFIGYINLRAQGKVPATSHILSIADLSFSSKKKRLWIVDLAQAKLLINTWVAHGQGSGNDVATHFSNNNESHQSSLGFYVTGEVYRGKHGRSLRLDGMDRGFNDRARARAIVVHGASYVSGEAIQTLDRLGRSFGCPAVPATLSDRIIDLIKDKTVLYLHADIPNYRSAYLDERSAVSSFL